MSKKQNIYKEFLEDQSEFSHRWSCWANNHMGWSKMKKKNKKIAKKRMKRFLNKETENILSEQEEYNDI